MDCRPNPGDLPFHCTAKRATTPVAVSSMGVSVPATSVTGWLVHTLPLCCIATDDPAIDRVTEAASVLTLIRYASSCGQFRYPLHTTAVRPGGAGLGGNE